MRKRFPTCLILLAVLLLLPLAGCTRRVEQPGDSRLLIPGLSDETPYDRPHADKGSYIQHLP